MVTAYIGIGSNLGQPLENLRRAMALLGEREGVKIKRVSSVYLTEPVGYEDQDWFHNAAGEIETSLSPQELLELLQEIEKELGRVRVIRWGPRTVDLDILCYGHEQISTDSLQTPHPRMLERAFVLAPLSEIAADLVLTNGKTVMENLKNVDQDKKILCIQQKIW